MKKRILLILALTGILGLTGCNTKSDTEVSSTGFCFDTTVTITIYSYSGESESEDIVNECLGLCNHYDSILSRTAEDSDVSKINNSNGEPMEVNQVVADLINDSLEYSQMSDGAFDITVAPLTELWDIDNNTGNIPDENEIQEALKNVNYKTISVEGDMVTLSDPDAEIDLGGIAKGFVADKLKSYMVSEGVTSAIIDLGGNILSIGGKTDDTGFTIGIKEPFSEESEDYAATVEVTDQSVVTSGIYERYFEKDGKIYHHILDTTTGYPVENNLYSVTIISKESLDGDALSTTAFVMGLSDGMDLINSIENIEAVFITDEDEIVLSDGLEMDEDNKITLIEDEEESEN